MIFNLDEVWFKVETPEDKSIADVIIAEDIESFTYTEELKTVGSGKLVLDDHRHVYSHILKPGMLIQLSFGIRPSGWNPVAVSRENVFARIRSPGGKAGTSGDVQYEMDFQCYDFWGIDKATWQESASRENIVKGVITEELHATPIVDFSGMNKTLDLYARSSGAWRFLVQCADEWNCALFSGYDQKGVPYVAMVDYAETGQAAKKATGRSSLYLEYGTGSYKTYAEEIAEYPVDGGGGPNVMSYSWKDKAGNAIYGDGVSLTFGPDGQPELIRKVVEGEDVKVWRLIPERIREELSGETDPFKQAAMVMTYVKAPNFESVKRFFEPCPETTAPQGTGVEVSAQLLGDPLICAGMSCFFGIGFPDRIGSKELAYWVRRASHTMSRHGYTTSVDIVDSFYFSDTGQKLAGELTGAGKPFDVRGFKR